MLDFNPDDYINEDDTIIRISEKEVAPHFKRPLLKKCLHHFLGTETPKLQDFEFCEEIDPIINNDGDPEWTNCICSQKILKCQKIIHLPTNKSFKIGRNCFEDLYDKKHLEDTLFFKPFCKECDLIKVKDKRSLYGKEGFCSKKCMNYWNKKAECIDCKGRFWRQDPRHLRCKKCYFKSFYGYRNKASGAYDIK